MWLVQFIISVQLMRILMLSISSTDDVHASYSEYSLSYHAESFRIFMRAFCFTKKCRIRIITDSHNSLYQSVASINPPATIVKPSRFSDTDKTWDVHDCMYDTIPRCNGLSDQTALPRTARRGIYRQIVSSTRASECQGETHQAHSPHDNTGTGMVRQSKGYVFGKF